MTDETLQQLDALGSAKAIMRAVHHAHEDGQPLRAVQLHLDDHPALQTLVELAYLTQDSVTDILGITTNGRLAIGLKPAGVLDLPVEVAEVTGNIAESELAARYLESKIAGIDKAISLGQAPRYHMALTWEEAYQHVALTMKACADEFRQEMHVPSLIIEGKVIPYNEDNDSGVRHADSIRLFFDDVHGRNVKAGWWSDLATGLPKKRSVGELFILFVTEMAEAYDAWLLSEQDDKLPQYPGIGVELADLGIRWADFCGAAAAGSIIIGDPAHNPGDMMFREIVDIARRYEAIRKTPQAIGDDEHADFLPPMDIAAMIDAKLDFNAHRPDHKIENRLKDDGKRT